MTTVGKVVDVLENRFVTMRRTRYMSLNDFKGGKKSMEVYI